LQICKDNLLVHFLVHCKPCAPVIASQIFYLVLGLAWKRLSHQIRTAWKWYQSTALSLDMLIQALKNVQILPLTFSGPLKFLSRSYYSLFYWNMNRVNTRNIPNDPRHIPVFTR
jgi:hypothetical protein